MKLKTTKVKRIFKTNRLSVEERFWSRSKRDETTGCLLFCKQDGSPYESYGLFWFKGKLQKASRMAFQLKHGPIPDGMCVLHRCDNPPCIEDSHLFLGTHQDNADDKVAKGRQWHPIGDLNASRIYRDRMPRGDNHPSRLHPECLARGDRSGARLHPESYSRGECVNTAKITAADVIQIRKLHTTGKYSYAALSKIFDVTSPMIGFIVRRESWKHVE